ncbi:MAG: hypothetical protein RL684_442 [Pseudomonadota bacterium]
MQGFLENLRVQRWDDHRYYHQSRINQTLHFISALSFLYAYVLAFTGNLAAAALVGWLVSMATRQSGHFFFEPKGYDEVNEATHQHKEEIKVGYNLHRKVVLMAVWVLSPAILLASPTLWGLVPAAHGGAALLQQVGVIWFWVGVGALLFRLAQLTVQQSFATGITWICKILTDPFHDALLYWKAPFHLLRGELLDPMDHARDHARDHDRQRA